MNKITKIKLRTAIIILAIVLFELAIVAEFLFSPFPIDIFPYAVTKFYVPDLDLYVSTEWRPFQATRVYFGRDENSIDNCIYMGISDFDYVPVKMMYKPENNTILFENAHGHIHGFKYKDMEIHTGSIIDMDFKSPYLNKKRDFWENAYIITFSKYDKLSVNNNYEKLPVTVLSKDLRWRTLRYFNKSF